MFANLPKLKELDVSNFDTRKVTDMSGMFSSMEELKHTTHISHIMRIKIT